MIGIQRMRNAKAKVVPVNNSGDWNHFKITQRQYLGNIPGEHEIKGLKKTAIFGHCTQTVESADVKVQNRFHGRNNITCSTECKYRTAAMIYTLETWFVSGI
jgi:hypothetical protein